MATGRGASAGVEYQPHVLVSGRAHVECRKCWFVAAARRAGLSPLLGGGIMRTRSTLLTIGRMALGGLLGYAAASGQFTSLSQAHAAAQSGESRPVESP
jgi:hypothetical protein